MLFKIGPAGIPGERGYPGETGKFIIYSIYYMVLIEYNYFEYSSVFT